MRQRKADAFLLTNPLNVTYLSGFSGEESSLIVTGNKAILVTDRRYAERAESEAPWLDIITRKRSLIAESAALLSGLSARKALFEEDHISQHDYSALRRNCRLTLPPSKGMIQQLRAKKDHQELKAIRKAISIAQTAFRSVKHNLAPGIRECDVAAMLIYQMRQRGAEKEPFDLIVASGPATSRPHAKTSTRKIRIGDILLIDWGAKYRGYCSDLTRVCFIGKIPPKAREIYQIVLAAQNRAIREIRPGRGGKRIDGAARAFIRQKGYERNFMHGLGHGIGLAPHEIPAIGPSTDLRLTKGMVITVEPGIYLPLWGGIRIEDMILVTKDGAELLTSLPRSIGAALVPA